MCCAILPWEVRMRSVPGGNVSNRNFIAFIGKITESDENILELRELPANEKFELLKSNAIYPY
jgi:hypothetical protein